jgi:signal transduction histidine kinase
VTDPAQLISSGQRRKWIHVTTGVTLIVLSVALTVGWLLLGAEGGTASGAGWRWIVYSLGTVLFLLLTAGLVLIVLLLLREVRLNERQSNFVSAVTHELKTPVASLKLYLDTLQMRQLSPEQQREFYRTMGRDIDRLNTTINNVLNAAMYTDRPVVDPQPLDFAKLVQRAIELTESRHQLEAGTIRYEGPASLTLKGDAPGLETAVLNLLDNAVKYSKETIDVAVDLGLEAGQARLRVSDRGVGMSRPHLSFVFNRFYRIGSEVRRSRTGTGLGLYIVKSVVRGHRGTVSADSPGLDRGTTFTLTLPGVVEELAVAHG